VNRYQFVDADAHVEECDATWSYLDPEFQARRPLLVKTEDAPGRGNLDAFWVIDGKALPAPVGRGASFFVPPDSALGRKKSYSRASQELSDVNARLREMDRMGIDIQVIFPTIFIFTTSDDPRFEAALYRSYNTWLSAACKPAAERIKWNALMPVRSVNEAVREVKRARELGAVGATIYGTAGDTLLHDRSLDPFYAALCEHDLPLCVHVGPSCPGLSQVVDNAYAMVMISNPMPVMMAFFSMVGGGVLDRFPDLRVGFFEAGSQWVPYVVDRMEQYHRLFNMLQWDIVPKREPAYYLEHAKLYLTCESEDRLLPQVLEIWGEDRVMASSDMPHTELRDDAKDEITSRGDLSEPVKRKLLVDNALAFYGLA
jgi:uncharacterized protein